MDAPQILYAEWHKLDTKEHMLYGFHWYASLENGNSSICRSPIAWGLVAQENPGDEGPVLHLGCGGADTGM